MGARQLPVPQRLDDPAAGRIVVGFDSSSSAHVTLGWAARQAVATHCRLMVVACLTVPTTVDFYGIGARQRQALDTAVDDLRHEYHDLRVEEVDTHVDPRDALLTEAVGAELLIVGASTAGSGRQWLFGSVPRTAVRRSSCPVAIVRGHDSPAVRRVAVGVDSSSAAAAALDWAIAQANRQCADLTVVHAWQRPGGTDRPMRSDDSRRADAQCVVDLAVRYCEERTTRPVGGALREGDPASVLCAASRDADLLVVGSRGRSGFKTMLFGSVALAVVDAAECPVVVIHPRLRPAMSDDTALERPHQALTGGLRRPHATIGIRPRAPSNASSRG